MNATMDLSVVSQQNIEYMIEQMKDKLKMANVDALRADNFATDHYEDLKFMYDMIMKRDHISANEMQAIVTELGNLRN